MALTETRPEIDSGGIVDVERAAPSQIERLIASGDHLANGRVFVVSSLVFTVLAAAGLGVAALDRTTAAGALGGVSDVLWPSSFVALVLMGVLPLLIGLGISVVPLQVGSPSIAFPRAAALSMWGWIVGSLLFLVSVVIDGGVGGADDTAVRLGNLSMGLLMASLGLGAVCVATTVLSHRPLGMGLAKVPLFSWSMLVAAPVWILTFGSAIAHVFLGHISRADAAGLGETFANGISWFLRAPAVYMVAIPLLGIAGDVVGRVSGRRLAPYGAFQGAIAAFAVLSFGVWTQNEAATQTIVWVAFAVVAGLPVVALLGGLVDVLRRGKVVVSAALGAALIGLLVLFGAVLSSAIQALDSAGADSLWNLQTAMLGEAQALFVVTAAALGGLAGLFHWSERLFGAEAPGGPAKGSTAAVLLGGALASTILLVEAIAAGDDRGGLVNGLVYGAVAVGLLLVVLGVLGTVAALLGAAREGQDGTSSEEQTGGTLEWAATGLAPSGLTHQGVVTSPYPLSDLRDGEPTEESK